jgi:sugar/nucleoside kinase (ribokinase family)
MTHRYDVVGIGNGILDILTKVRDDEIAALGLVHGGMALTDSDGQARILDLLGKRDSEMHAGGSAANTIVGLAQFGGNAAFICSLGRDYHAGVYEEGFLDFGIPLHAVRRSGPTATSLILVTPDGERTMNTHLGVAGELAADDIDPQVVADGRWLYVEGYLLTVPSACDAAFAAMEAAKRAGTQVAISFSDGFVVEHAGDDLRRAVRDYADLCFANEREAAVYAGVREPAEALAVIRRDCPNLCITLGAAGSLVVWQGAEATVPAFPATPVDLTGAGDMYAAGVLYGLTHGFDIRGAATLGAKAAHRVVLQIGARLPGVLRDVVLEVRGG